MDLVIRAGKIRAIGAANVSGIPEFDATGFIVAPGFFDIHVHLREPALKKRRRSLPEEALLLPEDLRQLPRCRIRILPTTIRRSRTTLSRKPAVRRPQAFS